MAYQLIKPLTHVAFIMDGNGRWANQRGLPRHLGHKRACEILIDIFDACRLHKIKVASFYAFSTENWNRPKREINHLFNYLEIFFKKHINKLIKDGARIIISGDISPLPLKTQETIKNAIEKTKDCNVITLNICLNYGGKAEIVKACKEIALEVKNNNLDIDNIDEKLFESHLYTKGLPNVDLMIRTSGEYRTSNYLPWQIAYAEYIFTDTYWPDFTPEVFDECLKIYDSRNRRFGGLKNE